MKQSTKSKSVSLVSFLLALILATLCPVDVQTPKAHAAPDKLVISTGIDPTMALPLIAEKAGMFAKNNIDGRVILAESGAAALDIMLTGNSHAAITVEIPGIKASSKGAKLYVAAKLNNGPTYNAIVTRKDVNKAEDLKGKKVAIVQKSASEYYFNKYLEVFKISPNDMNMMHLAPPEMIPAFMRDMIDAFAVWEPWPTRALEADPRAKILARASDQNLYDNPIFFYVSGDLAAKPDVLVRALRSLVLAENYIQTNPPAVAKIVAEAYKIPEPLAAQLLGKIVFRVELRKDTINKYKDIAEWMKDKKLIDNLPDFDELFKTEFIKATAPDRTDL